jgi:hypothetical protein
MKHGIMMFSILIHGNMIFIITTLSITTLSIISCSTIPLGIMKYGKKLGKMALCIMKHCVMTLSIM